MASFISAIGNDTDTDHVGNLFTTLTIDVYLLVHPCRCLLWGLSTRTSPTGEGGGGHPADSTKPKEQVNFVAQSAMGKKHVMQSSPPPTVEHSCSIAAPTRQQAGGNVVLEEEDNKSKRTGARAGESRKLPGHLSEHSGGSR